MTDTQEELSYIAWCRRMVEMLAPGGMWAVPRSGLVFRKDSEGQLTLIERMPHMAGMLITAEQLEEQQDSDYGQICRYFNLAGVAVRDETTEVR